MLTRVQSLVLIAAVSAAGPIATSVGLQAQAANAAAASKDCRTEGEKWKSELSKQSGRAPGAFTELVFLENTVSGDANLCYYNRDYGVVGDPIYVAVFTANVVDWTAVRFEPCSVQSAAPSVLQSSLPFPDVGLKGLGDPKWVLQTFLARRCYNTAIDVTIAGRYAGKELAHRYPLSQYERYRATLQAGILYTSLHDASFGLRKDQTDPSKTFIYDKGPEERGPEYIATLNLYSILRYIPSLLGVKKGSEAYPGRDPIHDHDFLDRLGAVIGVGISSPKSRFAVGASFELIYGVSAIWVADFARVKRIAEGVNVEQPFDGVEAEIPTTTVWKQRPALGLSIDLRYLSLLFTGNRP